MSVYIGIDQALLKTGICIISDENTVVFRLVKSPTKLKGPQRLAYLRDETYKVLSNYSKKITNAAIEAQSLGSMGDLDQLGQINGVMQVLLTDLGSPPLKVPPATLKKFVTGNGHADKHRMRRATLDHWNIDITQDDLCDAHGLARFAQQAHLKQATLRHQVEAIHSVLRKKKRRPRIKKLFKHTM